MLLDTQVRQLVDGGDLAGAASLAIRELGPAVLRYLGSMLRNDADAADAFSIFAENLWKGLPTFAGQSSLRTWAFRIALNVSKNVRDEAWRRRARPFATGEASAIADEVRTRTALRVERQKDAFEELRKALTAEEQSLLALRLDQELSWEEVAEILEEDGTKLQVTALSKRFERLKVRLGALARERGMLD